jgi:hypothetical protein
MSVIQQERTMSAWEKNLAGTAVDHQGRMVVALENGQIVAFAGP